MITEAEAAVAIKSQVSHLYDYHKLHYIGTSIVNWSLTSDILMFKLIIKVLYKQKMTGVL